MRKLKFEWASWRTSRPTVAQQRLYAQPTDRDVDGPDTKPVGDRASAPGGAGTGPTAGGL